MKILLLYLTLTLQFFMLFPHFILAAEKLGPHGGHYRMSRNNHIELVSELNGIFLVYLLDSQLENPTVKNSTVNLKVGDNKDKINSFECMPMEDHFYCTNPKKIITSSNIKIFLKAKRLGTKLDEVSYPLPFKSKM